MSLIDELAAADVDLDKLKLGDLGLDIMSLGWTETEEGVLTEVVRENDKYSMNREEVEWLARVLDCCRRVHATGLARLYVCKQGETSWKYNGLYGAAAIVTEADLRMACAHYIRLVDLGGFNPNSSVILQQELYPGFNYTKVTPWFHTFEMNHYVAGLSFVKEEQADVFFEKVKYCMETPARDVVEDDVDSKEKTFMCIGDANFRSVSEGMTAAVAKKYAAGGITDGTEVSWGKKKELPPELAAALGQVGVSSTVVDALSSPRGGPASPRTPGGGNDKVIDLLRDPRVRSNTVTTTDGPIGDGFSMQWSKNKTPLTGDKARAEAITRTETKTNKGKSKKLFTVFGKKK